MIIIKKRFSVGVSMDFIAKQYAIEREKKNQLNSLSCWLFKEIMLTKKIPFDDWKLL